MPRVSVEQEAIHDPRLSAAARRMPLRRPEVLGWRLLSVWSLVTYTQSTRQRRCVVAEALGMRDASHLDALVEVGLAEDADDVRDIELAPMSELFGGFEWLGELRATAPSGGRARASTATRDPATGQMTTRDYHSEILALLAEGPVRSRAALARALRADRARVGSVLDELLASGEVACTEAGFALSPDDSCRTAAPDDNLSSGRTASALAPALAPAPSPAEGVARAPAVARPDDSCRTAAPDDNLSSGQTTAAATRQATGNTAAERDIAGAGDRYSRLYQVWREVVRDVGAQGVHDSGLIGMRHEIREAMNHPQLAKVSDADLDRAVHILGVQCRAKAEAGESDPWWLLSSAWRPGVLVEALKCPDEATARTRALRGQERAGRGRRPGGGRAALETKPARTAEEFSDVA